MDEDMVETINNNIKHIKNIINDDKDISASFMCLIINDIHSALFQINKSIKEPCDDQAKC